MDEKTIVEYCPFKNVQILYSQAKRKIIKYGIPLQMRRFCRVKFYEEDKNVTTYREDICGYIDVCPIRLVHSEEEWNKR